MPCTHAAAVAVHLQPALLVGGQCNRLSATIDHDLLARRGYAAVIICRTYLCIAPCSRAAWRC